MLEHGGKLLQAAKQYNIPIEHWLDLSTGINPDPWPASKIPIDVWTKLPDEHDGLKQAASNYYGNTQLLAVAGSQAAIQMLPKLRKTSSRIAILNPAYAEHAHAWQSTGFTVTPVVTSEIDRVIEDHDVLVLVNPNNPTGECFSVEQSLHWHSRLQQHNGWLVVDEAFIDSTPEHSLVSYTHLKGLIVLRSLGKFFGLAGARIGFMFADSTLLNQLKELLGPWTISGPSRYIATNALYDSRWQTNARKRLPLQQQRLQQLLCNHSLSPEGGTALFQWVKTLNAPEIHMQLAKQGILTRLFRHPSSLRFGLPATELQWSRLEQTLTSITFDISTVG